MKSEMRKFVVLALFAIGCSHDHKADPLPAELMPYSAHMDRVGSDTSTNFSGTLTATYYKVDQTYNESAGVLKPLLEKDGYTLRTAEVPKFHQRITGFRKGNQSITLTEDNGPMLPSGWGKVMITVSTNVK